MRKCEVLLVTLFLLLSAPYSTSASGKRPADKQEAELKKVSAAAAPFRDLESKVEMPLPLQLRDVGEKCGCPMDEAIEALKNK